MMPLAPPWLLDCPMLHSETLPRNIMKHFHSSVWHAYIIETTMPIRWPILGLLTACNLPERVQILRTLTPLGEHMYYIYIYNTRRLCHRTFTLSLPTILAQTTQCDMLLRQPGQYFLEGNISCTCTLPEVNPFSPIFEVCRRCMLLGLKAVHLPCNKNPTSCDCTHCMSLYDIVCTHALQQTETLRTSENIWEPWDAPVLQRYSIIQHQQISTARHQGT